MRLPQNSDAQSIPRRKGESPCATCGIREMSVCAVLSDEELDRLAEIISATRFAPRQLIFQEGDPAAYLFNVTGGTVKLYKLLADGRRQITGFLFPGDFLGLALNESYAYGAEAVTEVSLCRFPRRKLEALLEEFPKMEKRLLGIASNELAAAQDQMLLLGRKSAQEKIASFLLILAHRAVERGGPPSPIDLPMSRADIADYLGLTIETVSRTLTTLKKNELISLAQAGQVEVLQRRKLEAIAQGS